ncbi:hypothetical protein T484DRAFT_1958207 [Baffinella frigidus]|nr:hypothetical protein T484DRAFT_1958207 [Cryptophyta sp. CCMP2293]
MTYSYKAHSGNLSARIHLGRAEYFLLGNRPGSVHLKQTRGAMCQDESVESVKELMGELYRENNALVVRLNAMQERIEHEKDAHTRLLLKIEWMEEKERSVELLKRMLVSLQGVLEEDDDLSGETTPAACEGGLCRLSKDESSASHEAFDTDGVSRNSAARHPWTFPQALKERVASLNRIKMELFTMTMTRIAEGFVRERPVKPAGRPPQDHTWAAVGGPSVLAPQDDTGETPAAPASKNAGPEGPRRLLRTPALRKGLRPVRDVLRRMADTVDERWNPHHLQWGTAKPEWDYSF